MTEGVITIKDNSKATLTTRINEEEGLQPNVVINIGDDMKKKKKPGVFGFFKAAMFALRHRTNVKQKATQVAVSTQGDWKKLVGSMRPLHLQDNNNNTPNQSPAHDGHCATISSPSALFSSSETMSQYASVNDLKALDAAPDTMSQYASANDLKSLDLDSPAASSGTMSQYASANNLQELNDEEEEEEDPDRVFDSIGADDMIDAKAEQFILPESHFPW